jgi:large subunit ribosomal protein L13
MPVAPLARSVPSFPPIMPTTHVRSANVAERWLLYDAAQYTLGDLASKVAMNLMGKDRPTYTPSELNGAFVIVINAEKVRITGNKAEHKHYDFFSGYPGGLKKVEYLDMQRRRPGDIVRLAIKRMLPKSTLGRDMQRRLKVYAGPEHPHKAQTPTQVEKASR